MDIYWTYLMFFCLVQSLDSSQFMSPSILYYVNFRAPCCYNIYISIGEQGHFEAMLPEGNNSGKVFYGFWHDYMRKVLSFGSVSWLQVQEEVTLMDIERSWPDTWWLWSFLMPCFILYYPKENILKVLCWHLYWKCVKSDGSRMGALGGYWGFLTGDLEDLISPDVIGDLILPPGGYPENFV